MVLRIRTQTLLEYVSRGVFFGWAFTLLARTPTWLALGELLAWSLGIPLLALVGAGRPARRATKGARRAWLPIVVLTLLDHTTWVYGGILTGMLLGGLRAGWPVVWIAASAAAGALVGWGLFWVQEIRQPRWRLVSGGLCLASMVALIWGLTSYGWIQPVADSHLLAAAGFTAVCLFYLLVFTGRAEETELDVGLLALGLGFSLGQLHIPVTLQRVVLLLPLGLWVIYCERVRRHMVVFKHTLRALSHEQQHQWREALIWYRLALRVDPRSETAHAGNWRVHRKLDLANLAEDDELFTLIDPVVCLDRARQLVAGDHPAPDRLGEAHKLLDIVAYRRQDIPLSLAWPRARAFLAEGKTDAAHALVVKSIDLEPGQITTLPDHEAEAFFKVWALLVKHPLLIGCGGLDIIEQDQGFFRFLASVERRLRQWNQDEEARAFKALLYEKLTLSRYETRVTQHPDDNLEWLDHPYCWEMAQTLAKEPDQVDRALELLRIAEYGLPKHRLAIWYGLARLHAWKNDPLAQGWQQRIKQFGMDVGPARLSPSERGVFYETVKQLADQARADGNIDTAIENYQLYADSPNAGVPTLKLLKEMYEQRGDLVMALRPIEAALAYSLDDNERRNWLTDKSRIYAGLSVAQVTPVLKQIESFFDFSYCFSRAKWFFDQGKPDEEVIHYLDLAALAGSAQLLNVNYLLGRVYFRAADFTNAVTCLEAVRANKPARFTDNEQEKSFYDAHRILGDIYLEEWQEPTKAIECYLFFERYRGSGADTLFKLGRAYEQLGQTAQARKWYDMVLVYSDHPRAEAARAALARLGT